MSQYFNIGDRVLWNPGNLSARAFVAMAESLVSEAKTPTGIGPVCADDYEIDLPVFTDYVNALLVMGNKTNSIIWWSLMEGFLATALALLQEAGVEPPALAAGSHAERLRELRDRNARSMGR